MGWHRGTKSFPGKGIEYLRNTLTAIIPNLPQTPLQQATVPENTDPSTEELRGILKRLDSLFKKNPSIPYLGLQKFLCETGPPRVRVHPRQLSRILAELRNNRRPRGGKLPPGPWEPIPGYVVSPTIPPTKAADAAQTLSSTFSLFIRELSHRDVSLFAKNISNTIGATTPQKSPYTLLQSNKASFGKSPSTYLAYLHDQVQQSIVWVSNDIEWIYPDNPALWEHLEHCLLQNARPVIVARKVPLATFPVLKRVGAIAVETHHVSASKSLIKRVEVSPHKTLLPTIKTQDHIKTHAALKHLLVTLAAMPPMTENHESADLVRRGLDNGLTEGGPNQPRRLLDWALASNLELPVKWVKSVEQWIAWSMYRSRRKPPQRASNE